MRNLPYKPTEKQKLMMEAVNDYFGEINAEEQKSARKISLWLMGKRRGVDLTEEEKEISGTIRTNLSDKPYVSLLTADYPHKCPNFALNVKSCEGG